LNDTTIVPFRPIDFPQEWSIYVPRRRFVLSVTAQNPSGNEPMAFMAAASYNGILLRNTVTGSAQSEWKEAIGTSPSGNWVLSSLYDDSTGWNKAQTVCTANPAVNAFKIQYGDFIGGVSSPAASPKWVRYNACSNATLVYFRVVVDLTTLPEPACSDANSLANLTAFSSFPFQSFDIGLRTVDSKLMQIRITADNFWKLYMAGIGISGPGELSRENSVFNWKRITDLNFYLKPDKYLFAIRASDSGVIRSFITSIIYDGKMFAVSDGLSQWKITNNSTLASSGWNTDYNFDDSAWQPVSSAFTCSNYPEWGNIQNIFASFGTAETGYSCPQFMWYVLI
jgi:hypothetical protein